MNMRWPDIREWATIAMFALVTYVLWIVAFIFHDLEMFKTLATLIVGGAGFGAVCAFMWGGTKGSAGAVEAVTNLAANSSGPTPTPPPAPALGAPGGPSGNPGDPVHVEQEEPTP